MSVFATIWTGVVYTLIAFWISYRYIWRGMVDFTPSIWIENGGDYCRLKLRLAYTSMQPLLIEEVHLASLWRSGGSLPFKIDGLEFCPFIHDESYRPLRIQDAGIIEGYIDLSDEKQLTLLAFECGFFPRIHVKLQHKSFADIVHVDNTAWVTVCSSLSSYANQRRYATFLTDSLFEQSCYKHRLEWLYFLPSACAGYLRGHYYRFTIWLPDTLDHLRSSIEAWVLKWRKIDYMISSNLMEREMTSRHIVVANHFRNLSDKTGAVTNPVSQTPSDTSPTSSTDSV